MLNFVPNSVKMSALELKIYDILKTRFNEEEARVIVKYIEHKAENKYEQKKDILSTKEDIGIVRKELAEVKPELIKWCFIFWTGPALL